MTWHSHTNQACYGTPCRSIAFQRNDCRAIVRLIPCRRWKDMQFYRRHYVGNNEICNRTVNTMPTMQNIKSCGRYHTDDDKICNQQHFNSAAAIRCQKVQYQLDQRTTFGTLNKSVILQPSPRHWPRKEPPRITCRCGGHRMPPGYKCMWLNCNQWRGGPSFSCLFYKSCHQRCYQVCWTRVKFVEIYIEHYRHCRYRIFQVPLRHRNS